MSDQQQATLNDVRQLAAQLHLAFTGGEQDDTWFDLDTGPDALFGLNGTYQKSAAGIASAYGDLVRYQDRLDQVRQQSNS
jgi:hypothetical protein